MRSYSIYPFKTLVQCQLSFTFEYVVGVLYAVENKHSHLRASLPALSILKIRSYLYMNIRNNQLRS